MIDLYGGETPNVFKPMIMLEELGVEYRRLPCDIMKGEQFTPEFLAISPNNKVPAIVDHDPMPARPAINRLFGDYVPPKPLTFTEEERKMLFGNKQP